MLIQLTIFLLLMVSTTSCRGSVLLFLCLSLVFFTEADMIDGGRIGMKGEHSSFFSHSVSDCVFITGVSLECLIAFGSQQLLMMSNADNWFRTQMCYKLS